MLRVDCHGLDGLAPLQDRKRVSWVSHMRLLPASSPALIALSSSGVPLDVHLEVFEHQPPFIVSTKY